MIEKRDEKGRTLAEFLKEYDITKYDRPSVTVDNVIFARQEGRLAVLLIKRGGHPFIYDWAFPGGFLEMDEDLAEGAKRELLEETGVTGVAPVQLGAYGRPGRDPRGRIITVAFVSELPDGAVPKAADDAKEADLFFIDTEPGIIHLTRRGGGAALTVPYEFENGFAKFIPAEGVAGDHSQILADALKRMGEIM